MTLDEKILKAFPLVSYEENRAEEGHLRMIEETENREIYAGVRYYKRRYCRGSGKDVWVYLATIAPDAPARIAVSAMPLRTVKMVKRQAAEFDGYVVFAMNAGFFRFFNDGDLTPYGIQVTHGVEMALPGKNEPEYSNNWVGLTKQGETVIGNADDYYNHWRGKLEYAVGGSLRLIRDGKITLHRNNGLHPRTAIGIAADGTVILMCADGRTSASAGLSFGDMVELYTGLGYEITELLNLDGGGSTTVVLREDDGTFGVKNIPGGPPLPIDYKKYDLPYPVPCGETQARAVADCVLIVATDR